MYFQEAMPLRLKEVHFVNQPILFNMVWQMFKPFVKEKLKKRVNTSLLFTYCGSEFRCCYVSVELWHLIGPLYISDKISVDH